MTLLISRARTLVVLFPLLCAGCPVERTGIVFIDHDGDGVFTDGDEPLTEGHVFKDTTHHGAIARDGSYSFPAPRDEGILWVRGPDSIDPGPFWVNDTAEDDAIIDIPVRPRTGTGPFRFVIASDTHVGIVPDEDQTFGLEQATSMTPAPYFIAVTGDILQGPLVERFELIVDAASQLGVPYVPIPGGHDWYDGGALYRQYLGPPNYSFDAGGMHFVVLEDTAPLDRREAFLDTDLALVEDGQRVAVLMHRPADDELLRSLQDRGVDYLMTGHLHANRVLRHEGLLEYNTQPLLMGGIDLSPAGYRVFSQGPDGALVNQGHTLVNGPVITLVAPAPDQRVPACQVRIIAAVAPHVVSVSARVDDLPSVPLQPNGPWSHTSENLEICDIGLHDIQLEAEDAQGERYLIDGIFEVVADQAAPAPLADWPMLQGGPEHLGTTDTPLATPLQPRWITSVGGHVLGGSVVVAAGRVFVPVTDLGDGQRGGLVALDGASGDILWERRLGQSVRNAPAVASGIVVFGADDGTLHALDAATGETRWTYQLARHLAPVNRNLYAAPTIAQGVVYAGVRNELAALELETGEVIWSIDPLGTTSYWSSHTSPTVAGGIIITSFNLGEDGLFGHDIETGARIWNMGSGISAHMNASALAVADTAYVINATTRLSAIDIQTGARLWDRTLETDTFPWGFLATTTPAYRDGHLYIGTQRGTLHALDATTGLEAWRASAGPSPIRMTHYHGDQAVFPVAPVTSPGTVWIAGADGLLRALDASTGVERWSYDLGVPVASGLALAGSALVVATYDGSVRLFEPIPANLEAMRTTAP